MRSDAEIALRDWLAVVWPGVAIIYAPQTLNAVRPPRPYATIQAFAINTIGTAEVIPADEINDTTMTTHVRQFVEGTASINLFHDEPADLFNALRASIYAGAGKQSLEAGNLTIRRIGAENDIPSSEGTEWVRRRQADVFFAHGAHYRAVTETLAGVTHSATILEE